jgi:hypothetical protein
MDSIREECGRCDMRRATVVCVSAPGCAHVPRTHRDNWLEMRRIFRDAASTGRLERTDAHAGELAVNYAEVFFKHAFAGHLQRLSACASHCMSCALSRDGCQEEKHAHQEPCDDCQLAFLPLSLLERLAGGAAADADGEGDGDDDDAVEADSDPLVDAAERQAANEASTDDLATRARFATVDFLLYVGHLVRETWSGQQRAQCLRDLKPGDAMATGDWAMKWVPFRKLERTTEWFGKNGDCWHGIMITRRLPDGRLVTNFIDLVWTGRSQKWLDVLQMLQHSLVIINREYPDVKRLVLWTDNAGCYISKELYYHLPALGVPLGIEITALFHSEASAGKTSLDAHFGNAKEAVRRAVLSGDTVHKARGGRAEGSKDAVTPLQLYQRLTETVKAGNTVGLVTSVDRSDQARKDGALKKSIKGIRGFAAVEYKADGTAEFYEAIRLGKPTVFRKSDWVKLQPAGTLRLWIGDGADAEPKLSTLDSTTAAGEGSRTAERDTLAAAHDEERHVPRKAKQVGPRLECPNPRCTATFSSVARRNQHLEHGRHRLQETTKDFIITTTLQELDRAAVHETPIALTALDAVRKERAAIKATEDHRKLAATAWRATVQAPGWALRRGNRPSRMTDEVRELLREFFMEGEKARGAKVTEDEAYRRLKERGLPEPIVKPNVIKRYFSQLSRLLDNTRAMRELAEVCVEAEQAASQQQRARQPGCQQSKRRSSAKKARRESAPTAASGASQAPPRARARKPPKARK